MTRLDRWLGGFLVLSSVGITVSARGFTVGFLVDPMGPRGLPYLVAGLFLLGGGVLLLRKGPVQEKPLSVSPLGAQGACVGILVLYAATIPLLGFILSTVLAMGALARLFGGRWVPGLLVGVLFALSLHGLFAYGFALELPVGALWGIGP